MTLHPRKQSNIDRYVSWRKSTRSESGGGQCVEVGASDDDVVSVRDSALTSAGRLDVSGDEWSDFLRSISTR